MQVWFRVFSEVVFLVRMPHGRIGTTRSAWGMLFGFPLGVIWCADTTRARRGRRDLPGGCYSGFLWELFGVRTPQGHVWDDAIYLVLGLFGTGSESFEFHAPSGGIEDDLSTIIASHFHGGHLDVGILKLFHGNGRIAPSNIYQGSPIVSDFLASEYFGFQPGPLGTGGLQIFNQPKDCHVAISG